MCKFLPLLPLLPVLLPGKCCMRVGRVMSDAKPLPIHTVSRAAADSLLWGCALQTAPWLLWRRYSGVLLTSIWL